MEKGAIETQKKEQAYDSSFGASGVVIVTVTSVAARSDTSFPWKQEPTAFAL